MNERTLFFNVKPGHRTLCSCGASDCKFVGVEGVDLRPALEGCGETKWYARAASSHHCKAAFGFAFVVWRTTSAQIHVKR